ncbi:AraC family transcriptional regulator [Gordonia sp. CPCC 205515]|uniref:AraC family transcriptional regulator n=1 Tax=Gordonia sp. CPCC 205515 TaxID=3140791 RepID=UPI003AF33DC1
MPNTADREAPLAGHSLASHTDVEDFRSRAAELLTPHRIDISDGAATAAFRGEVRAARIGDMQVIYLEQGVDIDVDILEPIDYYDVMFAWRGEGRIAAIGDRRGIIDPTHGAMLSPGMFATMHMNSDYAQLHVRIERATLDRRLEALLRRPVTAPASFDVSLDLSEPQLATWNAALRVALTDLDAHGGSIAHPLAAANWQDFLLTGLLTGSSHSYRTALDEIRTGTAHSRAVRDAMDFCRAHVADVVATEDVARHAGTTVRSLQRAFRTELDMSPTEYLRALRLDEAHRELSEMTADQQDSVTEVAYRWGFTHVSRFAGAYRARFGELPSATRSHALRR